EVELSLSATADHYAAAAGTLVAGNLRMVQSVGGRGDGLHKSDGKRQGLHAECKPRDPRLPVFWNCRSADRTREALFPQRDRMESPSAGRLADQLYCQPEHWTAYQ